MYLKHLFNIFVKIIPYLELNELLDKGRDIFLDVYFLFQIIKTYLTLMKNASLQ